MSSNQPEQPATPEPNEPAQAPSPHPEPAQQPAPDFSQLPESHPSLPPMPPVQPQLPPIPPEQEQQHLPPIPPEQIQEQLPPMPPTQAQQHLPPMPQYQPHPGQPQYPPVPAGWRPPPPAGGKIWLGILLGAGIPILCAILSFALSGTDMYQLTGLLLMLPFWIMLVVAIVLTILRGTRRTGIGMWIGLAAIPIIGFGVCVVAIFGSGF